MNKKNLFALLGCIALFGAPATAAETKTEEAPAKMDAAERRERMLKATGGILDIEAKGKVVIVNAQNKIAASNVEERVARLSKDLRMNVELLTTDSWEMYKNPAGAVGSVVLVDRPDLPMSVVAAENCWGLLNVAPLCTAPDKTEKRFMREFARVVCFAFGQSFSQFRGSPLSTVDSPEALDSLFTDNMTFDAMTMVIRTLTNRGMTQRRKTSYKKACRDGWAPSPTNDYQKAIWEEVQAEREKGPANGLKIAPPVKK